ncbi:hypothetical protein VTL71DRAFT_7944 [Oculimacula yallundae]|uniref:Uncharacterized protein n=1 Tax=Oculimacula yallundae TaxID=86028 RepID=A0ABR4CXG8_9HELO
MIYISRIIQYQPNEAESSTHPISREAKADPPDCFGDTRRCFIDNSTASKELSSSAWHGFVSTSHTLCYLTEPEPLLLSTPLLDILLDILLYLPRRDKHNYPSTR